MKSCDEFYWLTSFLTLVFHKVYFMIALMQIFCRLSQWKNFENRPVFDEVMCGILWLTFLAHAVCLALLLVIYVQRWGLQQRSVVCSWRPPTRQWRHHTPGYRVPPRHLDPPRILPFWRCQCVLLRPAVSCRPDPLCSHRHLQRCMLNQCTLLSYTYAALHISAWSQLWAEAPSQ